MPDKKRLPLSRKFYFIVLLPLSFVFIVLEGVYLKSEISVFLIPMTVALFSGLGAYLGSRRSKMKNGVAGSNLGRRVEGAFKDNDLSKEFSEEGQRILGKDVEIYRQVNGNPSKTWSPALSIHGRTPRIVLSETFFYGLNSGEKRAMIIHEIYHYAHKDMILTYLLTIILVSSVVALIAFLVYGILYGMSELIYSVIIFLLLLSFVIVVILKLHLVWQEYRSDMSATKEMGGNEQMKSVIKKASEYAKLHSKEDSHKRIQNQLDRRLKHLES